MENASSSLAGSTSHQKITIMTTINVFDMNGKIVYHSVEPRLMTEAQVRADLDAWGVKKYGFVQIIYDHDHV